MQLSLFIVKGNNGVMLYVYIDYKGICSSLTKWQYSQIDLPH